MTQRWLITSLNVLYGHFRVKMTKNTQKCVTSQHIYDFVTITFTFIEIFAAAHKRNFPKITRSKNSSKNFDDIFGDVFIGDSNIFKIT